MRIKGKDEEEERYNSGGVDEADPDADSGGLPDENAEA